MTKVNNNYSVVLATDNIFLLYSIICKVYLHIKYGINSRIFVIPKKIKEGDLVIGENEILLPFSIKANKLSENLPNCLVMTSREIDFLDDKQSSGQYIDNLGIPNIPTFYNNKNQNEYNLVSFVNNFPDDSIFCIKRRNTLASEDIKCLKKNDVLSLYREDKNNLKDYIIQLYIECDYLISIDCVCLDGKIESFIVNKSPLFLGSDKKSPRNRYLTSESHDVLNEYSGNIFYDRVYQYTKNIVNSVKYNGFIQIEWLCREKDNKILFLEINPRVSGGISFSNYREIYNISIPYIDTLVLKYIIIVLKKNDKNDKNDLNYKENRFISDFKNKIPDKHSLPKKVTHSQFNFAVRPLFIILTVVVFFLLVSKIKVSAIYQLKM